MVGFSFAREEQLYGEIRNGYFLIIICDSKPVEFELSYYHSVICSYDGKERR